MLSVLHGLRIKGFAAAGAVSEVIGLDEGDVASTLADLQAEALVTYRDGRVSGWTLTAPGRARHAQLIAQELEESGTRGVVDRAYRRFLEINGELLQVCTDWQLRDGGMNDHTDESYDKAVVGRLRGVDEAVQPVCADLVAALGRFSSYGRRLRRALERVEAGDSDWFAKPMIESYHTVWFELHEDLLVTLGIERAREGET